MLSIIAFIARWFPRYLQTIYLWIVDTHLTIEPNLVTTFATEYGDRHDAALHFVPVWWDDRKSPTFESVKLFQDGASTPRIIQPLRRVVAPRSSSSLYFLTAIQQSHSYLIPGQYEVGLKVWECSLDLCLHFKSKISNNEYREELTSRKATLKILSLPFWSSHWRAQIYIFSTNYSSLVFIKFTSVLLTWWNAEVVTKFASTTHPTQTCSMHNTHNSNWCLTAILMNSFISFMLSSTPTKMHF